MGRRGLCPERGFALSVGGFALVLVAIMALVAARQKRERQVEVIDNLLDSGCPVSKLLRTHLHRAGDAEDDEGLCTESMRKLISKQLHAYDSIETPYGTLIQDMEVPCVGTPPLTLAYINPFALLYYCSTISREFYDFMCQSISSLARNLPLGRPPHHQPYASVFEAAWRPDNLNPTCYQ